MNLSNLGLRAFRNLGLSDLQPSILVPASASRVGIQVGFGVYKGLGFRVLGLGFLSSLGRLQPKKAGTATRLECFVAWP